MSDLPQDPFGPSEENPLGGYEIPFEALPGTQMLDLNGHVMDQVDVQVGIIDTPLGPMVGLIFNFRNSANPKNPMPPIIFITTDQGTFMVQNLVQKAATAGRRAVREMKKRG